MGGKNETENDSRSFFSLGKAYSIVSLLLSAGNLPTAVMEVSGKYKLEIISDIFPRMQKELI